MEFLWFICNSGFDRQKKLLHINGTTPFNNIINQTPII